MKKQRVNKRENWSNDRWYKHYRNQYFIAKAVKYICVGAPIVILFLVKCNVYFKIIDGQTPYRLTIGALCAVIVGVIAVISEIKKTESEEVKGVLTVLNWWMAFVIIYCFNAVFADLQTIVMYEAIGITASYSVSMFEKNRKKWADAFMSGKVNAQTMKDSFSDVKNTRSVD